MTKVQHDRLIKTAEFFEKLPKEKFDISKIRKDIIKTGTKPQAKMDCKTTCCIVGWLPTLFPGKCRWEQSELNNEDGQVEVDYEVVLTGQYESSMEEVCAEVLGLTEDESQFCYPDWWPQNGLKANPKNVAKLLRRYAENYKTKKVSK